jgi:hypothetical protein
MNEELNNVNPDDFDDAGNAQSSDEHLIGLLRAVSICESLQEKLLAIGNQTCHTQLETGKPIYGHRGRLFIWAVVASVVVGTTGLILYLLTIGRDNGDAMVATGPEDNVENTREDTTNEQPSYVLAEIEKLEELVAKQWQPKSDYSLTSDVWSRQTKTRLDSMVREPANASSRFAQTRIASNDEDIPSVLYHTALLGERLGNDSKSVRSEFNLVINHFPNSVYAQLSQRQIDKIQ